MNEICTIYETLYSEVPNWITIETALRRIQLGKSGTQNEVIRSIADKEKRDQEKYKLPAIRFSGKFSGNKDDSLIEHSGYMVLDFDDTRDLGLYEQLKNNKSIVAVWDSPSLTGYKALIKIADGKKHREYFASLLKEFPQLDKSGANESRICFESYDPDMYLRSGSVTAYDVILKEEKKETDPKIHHDFQKLLKWLESKGEYFNEGNRNSFIFKLGCACCRIGIGEEDAVFLIDNEFLTNDPSFKSSELQKTVRSAYKRSSFNSSAFSQNGDFCLQATGDQIDPSKDSEPIESILDKTLAEAKIDVNKKIEKPPIVFSIFNEIMQQYSRVFTLGNFSIIKGKSKSKKTFLLSMLSSTLSVNGELFGIFKGALPEGREHILYFDTEQSEYDAWKTAQRTKEITGKIGNITHYCLRQFQHLQRCTLIEHALKKHSGIGVVFIDGIADLASAINDEEEANRVVGLLMTWSKIYDCHICCVIHENKDNNFATGHLGSKAMKQAEVIIGVTKDKSDKKISIVECDMIRGAMDFEPFSIQINDKKLPEIIGVSTPAEIKELFDFTEKGRVNAEGDALF